jgi:phosphatidylglycerol---prolipoprotein diacylglyceryl transferase
VRSFLSFGRFHIPVYGLFAAVGLMCALLLGQRTARAARIDRDAFWDAGMVTVFSAFVLSRVLLVVENVRTFLMYPVLVLELPSLTLGGVALTAIVALLYLRRRRLPLLTTLDAAAPCAALVWAFLGLGRFAEGTRDGMPSTVPWAVSSSFGRVHPSEIYSAVGWLVLCAVLLWILEHARAQGETTAWGLVLGGLLLFVLEFFRLPLMLYGSSLLDAEEWHALGVMGAGSLLLAWCVGVGARDAKGVGDAV